MSSKRLVWLFDVDGTLLLTEGAAHEAFVLAVRDVLEIDDDLADIAFAGRTEPLIVADILRKHRRHFVDGEEPRFWNAVFDHMRDVFRPDRGRLLPGVPELLAAVNQEPAWVSGLLTGNMTQMARIKLEHFGITNQFAFGAFGEEAQDRDALARVAVERAARYGVPPDRCVVVGDTEHDIACARAAGARVIAVATGPRRREELRALGADLAMEDLSETTELIAWGRGVANGE